MPKLIAVAVRGAEWLGLYDDGIVRDAQGQEDERLEITKCYPDLSKLNLGSGGLIAAAWRKRKLVQGYATERRYEA